MCSGPTCQQRHDQCGVNTRDSLGIMRCQCAVNNGWPNGCADPGCGITWSREPGGHGQTASPVGVDDGHGVEVSVVVSAGSNLGAGAADDESGLPGRCGGAHTRSEMTRGSGSRCAIIVDEVDADAGAGAGAGATDEVDDGAAAGRRVPILMDLSRTAVQNMRVSALRALCVANNLPTTSTVSGRKLSRAALVASVKNLLPARRSTPGSTETATSGAAAAPAPGPAPVQRTDSARAVVGTLLPGKVTTPPKGNAQRASPAGRPHGTGAGEWTTREGPSVPNLVMRQHALEAQGEKLGKAHLEFVVQRIQQQLRAHQLPGTHLEHFLVLFLSHRVLAVIIEATNEALAATRHKTPSSRQKYAATDETELLFWLRTALMLRLRDMSKERFFEKEAPRFVAMPQDRFDVLSDHICPYFVQDEATRWADKADHTARLSDIEKAFAETMSDLVLKDYGGSIVATIDDDLHKYVCCPHLAWCTRVS